MPDILGSISPSLDSYSRTARLAPGLLLLLGPVAVGIGAGLPEWPAASGLAVAAVVTGLPVALADWVRRHGQQLQDRLWKKWGGNPVVVSLRQEGVIADQRRKALAEETELPVDDTNHPNFEHAAENAVRQLISACRDKSEYPLVFAENKAYGFARNLLAVRKVGVYVSSVSLVIGILLVGLSTNLSELSKGGVILGALSAAAILAFWIWYPSEERVQTAAHDYRDRLLEALDSGALASS
jgi:hypothetical protein